MLHSWMFIAPLYPADPRLAQRYMTSRWMLDRGMTLGLGEALGWNVQVV